MTYEIYATTEELVQVLNRVVHADSELLALHEENKGADRISCNGLLSASILEGSWSLFASAAKQNRLDPMELTRNAVKYGFVVIHVPRTYGARTTPVILIASEHSALADLEDGLLSPLPLFRKLKRELKKLVVAQVYDRRFPKARYDCSEGATALHNCGIRLSEYASDNADDIVLERCD